MNLCKAVKDDIAEKLKRGIFPIETVNAMPIITIAVVNSRNGFRASHFSDDADLWSALFLHAG